MWFSLLAAFVLLVLVAMAFWRFTDDVNDQREMKRLLALQPIQPLLFDPSMITGLPEPAQRYFRFSIAEGTPLLTVVDLRMSGVFSLGTKEEPNYISMKARQVLASPHGFVWKMRAQSGHLGLSGSDSASWTRFWMGGFLPVARKGGDDDHARAAFGRYVAESVFWTPAALLPNADISWEGIDADTAQVTMMHKGMEQSVRISVTADGAPESVSFERWSDANAERKYQHQPFGGYLSKFQKVDGFRIPTHVEAGNFFGTDSYFPFFIADVTDISYPYTHSNPE